MLISCNYIIFISRSFILETFLNLNLNIILRLILILNIEREGDDLENYANFLFSYSNELNNYFPYHFLILFKYSLKQMLRKKDQRESLFFFFFFFSIKIMAGEAVVLL
jgi:hypothetical protein